MAIFPPLSFQYEKTREDGTIENRFFTPPMRAAHLGMGELAEFLLQKQKAQIEKRKKHETLLPRRAISTHLSLGPRCKSVPSIFVTQSHNLSMNAESAR